MTDTATDNFTLYCGQAPAYSQNYRVRLQARFQLIPLPTFTFIDDVYVPVIVAQSQVSPTPIPTTVSEPGTPEPAPKPTPVPTIIEPIPTYTPYNGVSPYTPTVPPISPISGPFNFKDWLDKNQAYLAVGLAIVAVVITTKKK